MLRFTLLFTSLLALLLIGETCVAAETDRPNVVLIFTDDQGMHDVGCYGSELPTPHIDSLARDGLKFTQWYSASSICTPSRYGLLTGKNPCRSRDRLLGALMFLSAEDKARGLRHGETTVASLLGNAGYRTALMGKWHLGHGDPKFLPTRHGFDTFRGHTGGCVDFFTMRYGNTQDWYRDESLVDVTGYATDVITEDAVGFLNRQQAGQPFFLYLAYNAPHFGKGWNDGESITVNQLQPPPGDLARVSAIADITRRKYAAMVVNLDDGIGRVLRTLDQQNLSDNTLVIFITDHGGDPTYGGANDPFRGGKSTLFEGGIRVPCLMRWPRVIQAGSTTDSVAWSVDLLPTLCKLGGVPVDHEIDGQDISGLLQGATDAEPREMFWQLGAHDELDRGTWSAIRQGDWKFIADPEGHEYLFELGKDPGEQHNHAESNAELHKRKLHELRARAAKLSVDYRD